MKGVLATAAFAAATVQAGWIPPNPETIDWRDINTRLEKRQIVGTVTSLLGKGGKVEDPPGAAPKRYDQQSPSKVPGAKRVKMRYGPYKVPNMNKTSLVGEYGMLWNYPDTAITKPCSECVIIGQQAGLEYPDGKNANIDTGMWLHHMVHFTIGPGRSDPTCYGRPSLPHVDVGASPMNSERYFSSGNERTHVQIDKNGLQTKAGYQVKTTDRMAFIVDLMNMNMEDKTVYLTMYYDILAGRLPAGWKDLKPVWFDAAQCGTSEVTPKKQSGDYMVSSGTWKPNFDGEVVGVGGHLHDGGVHVSINVNGKENCKSTARYGETKEYIFGGMKMGAAGGMADKHISTMTACYFDDMPIRQLSADQTWQIHAKYDYNQFPGNKEHDGKQASVMAIAIMFVAIEPGTTLRGAAGSGAGSAPAAAPMGLGASPRQGLRGAGVAVPKAATPKAAAPAAADSDMAGMAGMSHGHSRRV